MRYNYFLILLAVFAFACNGNKKNSKDGGGVGEMVVTGADTAAVAFTVAEQAKKHYENIEIIPLAYNESKDRFSGTFLVSSDYYAELAFDIDSRDFQVYINGVKSTTKLDLSSSNLSYLSEYLSVYDYNEDGFMDLGFEQELYLFDKEKECFIPAPKDDYAELKKTVGSTVGFITFPEPGEKDGLKDKAYVINNDGTQWMIFYIDYWRHSHEWKENFRPWAFEPGIGVFVIRCTKVNADSYTIVVNESLKIEKRLKKNPNIKFSTLEEHILHVPIIDFDEKTNPMRKAPDEHAQLFKWDDTDDDEDGLEFIHAVEMKGDWIRLEAFDGSEKTYPLGWIKWRQGDIFLIEFFYSV